MEQVKFVEDNFETAQLTNIWIDRRQLQSRQQVQIFCSDLLLIHIQQDRRIRNYSVHLIKNIIFSYFLPVLLAIFWVICLWNIEHSSPTLLETENTNGVKVPCSMFITRLFNLRCLSHVSQEFWLVIGDSESLH